MVVGTSLTLIPVSVSLWQFVALVRKSDLIADPPGLVREIKLNEIITLE